MASPEDEALRRFLACRGRADGEGMGAAWCELVELLHDRIATLVALQGSKTGMSPDEREDVVQEAHLSAFRFAHSFQGSSMGELHMALVTIVQRRCADHIRRAIRDRGHFDHLEDAWDGEEGGGDRVHRAEVTEAWEQHARGAEQADARAFIAWALPQIEDRRRRLILERDLDGIPGEATATHLGITMANLYQIRRRANLDLRELHEEYMS